MNIPDKAVEAVVALAFKDAQEAEIDFDYDDLHGLRYRILNTLEAAAPFIAAQALRDAADDIGGQPGRGEYYQGMDAAAASLHDRADEMEAGK